MDKKMIDVAREFSRYPAGRYHSDGPYNGQKFREEFLLPWLRDGATTIVVDLSNARGLGSSFLEEAFGGLVRVGVPRDQLRRRLEIITSDDSLTEEIWAYIDEASPPAR